MKRNTLIITIVLVAAAVVAWYRYDVVQLVRDATAAYDLDDLHEVTTTLTYDVPDGEDSERFHVYLDDNGVIVLVTAENILEPEEEAQVHIREFAHKLTQQIKGKKLSELEGIDKVGTSSLTTAAFNAALLDLQAQL